MSRKIDVCQAADLLKQAGPILILTHRRPDGDTVGSAAALCRALRKAGKEGVACALGSLYFSGDVRQAVLSEKA